MPPDSSFLLRFSLTLLAVGLLLAAFYLGQDILVPFAMAGLLAVLLRPVEAWLSRRGLSKGLAISIALLLAIVVLVGLISVISMQLARFADDWPKLQKNLTDFYRQARSWIQQEYNLSYGQQDQYLKKAQAQTLDSLQGSGSLGLITGPLGTVLLLPIYVFLLLYYRTLLMQVILRSFAREHTPRVREVLGEIRRVIQSYVVGLVTETACVALLNSVGLLLLGVQYAVLMGVIAALLNLIPYIGGLVATGLAVAVTFVNDPDPTTLLGVVGVFLTVQFIDNNFFVPVIIGSKVRLNALVSLLGVLIGGALAGVSGMFLSIPLIAVLKVVFDRVEGMEPWGILLGDDSTEADINHMLRLRRRKSKPPAE
jgi:predicted PurR-regulated permease PerM